MNIFQATVLTHWPEACCVAEHPHQPEIGMWQVVWRPAADERHYGPWGNDQEEAWEKAAEMLSAYDHDNHVKAWLKWRYGNNALDYEINYHDQSTTNVSYAKIAAALQACDWSEVPIGNKVILQAAINALGIIPMTHETTLQRLEARLSTIPGMSDRIAREYAILLDEENTASQITAPPIRNEVIEKALDTFAQATLTMCACIEDSSGRAAYDQARAAIKALFHPSTHKAFLPVAEWQDISTLPVETYAMNGVAGVNLAWDNNEVPIFLVYCDDSGKPTDWMPLPTAPAARQDEQ